jgi:hypothetical protein
MKLWMGCVAALWLGTTSARAGDGAEADWSIGAGIGFGYGLSSALAGSLGYSAPYLSVSAPQASASVERRLSAANWLLMGVTANFAHSTAALPPASSRVYGAYITDQKQGGGAVSFGVRHFLTEPGAFIGVSLEAAARAGVQTVGEDYQLYDGNGGSMANHASATAWSVGGFGGIALDKPLLDRLTLRLAVALLSIDYAKATTSPSDTVQGAGSSFNAALIFIPDLELRLAF